MNPEEFFRHLGSAFLVLSIYNLEETFYKHQECFYSQKQGGVDFIREDQRTNPNSSLKIPGEKAVNKFVQNQTIQQY